jgi:uncharacterized membrane protein
MEEEVLKMNCKHVEIHRNDPCQGTISAPAGRNEDNKRNFEKAASEFRIRLGASHQQQKDAMTENKHHTQNPTCSLIL